MSFEIHLNIAEDSRIGRAIASLAAAEQITPAQAVEKIIDIAAQRSETAPRIRIPGLPSEPLSADEAAMMDEIVTEAMDSRRQRLERHSRA